MTENVVKLNLGCGKQLFPGYINIDMHNPEADLIYDLCKPLPYENKSIDRIVADHVIEHFHRRDWPRIIRDWSRILKIGGTINIQAPEIMRCAKNLLTNYKSKNWLLAIYGRGGNYQEDHKNGFTVETLTVDLNAVGIEVVSHMYFNDRKPALDGFNFGIEGVKKCS